VFENDRAWHSWLARKVMRLADGAMKGIPTNAVHMATVGLVIHEALGRFALATLERVERDRQQKVETDKAIEAWAFAE
jgi:hypothetical protein